MPSNTNLINIAVTPSGWVQIKCDNLDRIGLCRLANMLGPLAEIHATQRGKLDDEIKKRLIEWRSEAGVADA